jgi:integrase/recombinase XerD
MRVWLDERPSALQLDGALVTDAIFVNSRYPFTALTAGAIYRRIKDIAKAAGVFDHSNPHAFRHGLARRMLQNGAPLGAVSRILGHSDVKVTDQFYGVYLSAELKEAHARWG